MLMAKRMCEHPECTVQIAIHKRTCRRHGSLARPRCTVNGCERLACADSDRCVDHGGRRVVPRPGRQRLLRLVEQHGRAGAARVLLTSKSEVDVWMREYGLRTGKGAKPRPCPVTRRELARMLHEDGLEETARALHTSNRAVLRWRQEHGLPPARRRGEPIPSREAQHAAQEAARQKQERLAAYRQQLHRILGVDELPSDLWG